MTDLAGRRHNGPTTAAERAGGGCRCPRPSTCLLPPAPASSLCLPCIAACAPGSVTVPLQLYAATQVVARTMLDDRHVVADVHDRLRWQLTRALQRDGMVPHGDVLVQVAEQVAWWPEADPRRWWTRLLDRLLRRCGWTPTPPPVMVRAEVRAYREPSPIPDRCGIPTPHNAHRFGWRDYVGTWPCDGQPTLPTPPNPGRRVRYTG